MTVIKTPREPFTTSIPTEKEANDAKFERRWRISHTEALRELHRTIREDLVSGGFRIENKTPANASAIGEAGEICYDSSYIYVCISANTWKRVSIGSW